MADKSAKVLIVDDNAINRELLHDFILSMGHEPILAESGPAALAALLAQNPDLALLDIMMPDMGGEEVLAQIKANVQHRDLPVIMISAHHEMDTVVRCIQAGAEDYVTKPFNATFLKARVSACLERKVLADERENYRQQLEGYNQTLEQRVKEQVAEISLAQMATIFAMSKLAESRDEDTGEHLERMREYAKIVAEELVEMGKVDPGTDNQFILNLFAACPLHDIGKVGIPDRILLKPGRLTEDEFHIMKMHPSIGAETLRAVANHHPTNSFVHMGVNIAESHHEKWNGSGYPLGLKGEAIPIVGRIVALGDVYDALVTRRCYKEAFTHEKAKSIIMEGQGSHFDPDVVDAFLRCEQRFLDIRHRFQDTEKVLYT